MSFDNVTYLNLPPAFGAMQRLLEDDVTTENVEQHIAHYRANLATRFTPEQLKFLEPFLASFLESVRTFAAYEVGRGDD